MKKRFLSLLIVLLAVLQFMSPAHAAEAPANIKKYNTVTEYTYTTGAYTDTYGKASSGNVFSTAYVRNTNVGSSKPNGDRGNLEVVVTMKDSNGGSTYVCAIVMKASDFDSRYSGGRYAGAIASGSFHSLGSALTSSHYAIGRQDGINTTGMERTLKMAEPNADVATGKVQNPTCKSMATGSTAAGDNNYFTEYVLLVFGQNSESAASEYYLDRFCVDANGYVATPSYGIRYDSNLNNVKPVRVEGYGPVVPNGNAGNHVDLFRAAWTNDRTAANTSALPTANLATSGINGIGLEFMGWSENPQRVLSANEAVPDGWAVNNSYTYTGEPYQVHTLYAIWRILPVQFYKTAGKQEVTNFPTRTISVSESGDATLSFSQTPQVGVPFNSGAIAYAAPGSSTGQPMGNKRFKVQVYEGTSFDTKQLLENDGLVSGSGKNAAARPTGNATNVSEWLPDAYTRVTTVYGLSIQRSNSSDDGKTGDNHQWQITGTPDAFSGPGNHVWISITVQDSSNGTKDTIWVYFDQIKKGSQPSPTLDVNTGLEARVEALKEGDLPTAGTGGTTEGTEGTQTVAEDGTGDTTGDGDETGNGETGGGDENKDPSPSITVPTMTPSKNGQIFGFYSKGAQSEEKKDNVLGGESGYFDADDQSTKGRDGTGTVTDYYLRLGMVFEYRPIQVGGEDLTNAYTDPNSAYSQMPNEGWREVPFPSGYYTKPMLDALAASDALARNGKTVLTSSKAEARTGNIAVDATVALQLSSGYSETFQKTGWLDSYGKIVFEKDTGLPVIQLLNENDKYLVRFRATETYAASDAKEIVISGGGGGAEAKPDDFAAIVFYDWDETTVLGTLVVKKGADATDQVKAFAKTLQSPESKDVDPAKASYYTEEKDEDGNIKYPLTNKKGYSFKDVWLPFESDVFTHYGSNVQGQLVEKPTADAVDFTKVTGDLVVKACYEANDELYVENTSLIQYTTKVLSTVRDSNSNFLIEIQVMRKNTEGTGVPRLGKPAVRVTYTTGSGESIVSLINIDNKDTATFSLATNTKMKEYSINVIDTYDSTWTLSGVISSANGDVQGSVTNNLISGNVWSGTGFTHNGFIYEGTVAYINSLLAQDQTSKITQTMLDDIKLNYSMLPGFLPILKASAAAGHLKTAYQTLNQDGSASGLTYKQMQYAIVNNGALLTSDIY